MATALITGATAGIGRSIARQLAGHGHDVVLVARDGRRLDELAAEIRRQFRVDTEVLAADLTDLAASNAVEDRLADRDRPVEWLVNNAGFGVKEPFDASDLAAEQAMLDVLVQAPMRLTHAALPGMLERGRGRVLIVSSVTSFLAGGSYSAAKAWTTVFAESLSARYRSTGVHVTALCPGFTRTEFHARAEMAVDRVPDWLWLDADDVAEAGLVACAEGRAIAVPGAVYKGIHGLTQVLPRPMVRRLTGGG
jgi:uncharacterized protein